MNFFQHQETARRNTWKLIGLFVIAVAALIVMTNILVALVFGLLGNGAADSYQAAHNFSQPFNWGRFWQIALFVAGTIGLVMLFKWMQLRSGGRVIAERLGGTAIPSGTQDYKQRQLLNVIEEMAIAAGLPVPPVYLLPEQGINAFAAGYEPSDAVIGITRGSLEQLNRDQLQGVIAHEFSHILNGDMRINLRLIAVLSGIVFIGHAGRAVLNSGRYSRRKSNGGQLSIGLGLVVIGYIGVLMGSLIKAAISRQREFLADASAVQYTRNPQGIADALKIIGGNHAGSGLDSRRAEENSHLFFGDALRRAANSAMSTHPPLEERIRRIEPGWNGEFLTPKAPEKDPGGEPETTPQRRNVGAVVTSAIAASSLSDRIHHSGEMGHPQLINSRQVIGAIPDTLREVWRDVYQARALVLSLLIQRDKGVREKQLTLLEVRDPALCELTKELIPITEVLATETRLPLVELAIPALKQQSYKQFLQFRELIQRFIDADGNVSLYEWALQQVTLTHLQPTYKKPGEFKPRFSSLRYLDMECYQVLSFLALRGHVNFYSAETAFHQAVFHLELGPANLIRDEQLSLEKVTVALQKLNYLKPLLKQEFLTACAICVEVDSVITIAERELMRAIAAMMDCPLPLEGA
ncbi:M48 family metallopeptidase [Porticoccaceae bacterium LTM1]|nr:M48 family metallopeptidase [Porticoccaceae bacterium LTM1]